MPEPAGLRYGSRSNSTRTASFMAASSRTCTIRRTCRSRSAPRVRSVVRCRWHPGAFGWRRQQALFRVQNLTCAVAGRDGARGAGARSMPLSCVKQGASPFPSTQAGV
eukprot:5908279-Prymnesium_polylepis.1